MAQYGNLLHQIVSTKSEKTPVVGMGVTVLLWSDRHAGTITRVSPSAKTFWFRDDKATRTDNLGMTDSGQKYSYEPNPNAPEQKAILTKKGWKVVKGTKILLDVRDEHYDFSF